MNQGIPVNQLNGSGQASRSHQAPQMGVNQQQQANALQQQRAQQRAAHPNPAQAQQAQPSQAQRQMTQQQLQRQRHQLLFQKLKNYKFAETSEEILKKYSMLPPSLEFHIYDNHYRFGQQDGIIPKSSPLGKEFLQHIMREEIPDSLVEVIKDSGIQLYEGCVILNVIDHRNMVDKLVKIENEEKLTKAPKNYKTVLKPVQASIYADLLYQTDSAQLRLSDQSSLLLEAEILTLTKRNVDLSVPLNPYNCNDYLRPEIDTTKYSPEKDEVIHQHRVNNEPYHYKPLHEDSILTHHNQDEYEQMMSLFSENYKGNRNPLNLMNESNGSNSSQFLRLRFIENYRRKLERMKAAGIATNLQNKLSNDFSGNGSVVGANGAGAISNMLGLTPQQRLMIQQQRMIQQQQKVQMSNALNNGRANSGTGSQTPQATGPAAGGANGTDKKKPATKRPRKQPTKKQQAAAAAAAAAAGINLGDSVVSTPESGEPPVKKKRGTYKKKNKNLANDQAQQQQSPLDQQSQPQQQAQVPQQQQVPSNIMNMNFNMGNYPQ